MTQVRASMIKTLLGIAGLLAAACSQAASISFNQANNQITLPAVTVGTTLYANVVVNIGQVIKVSGGMAANTLASYDAARNQLTLPSVTVGAATYNNVVVSVASVASVGGQSAITLPVVMPTLGLQWPVVKYEAEAGKLSGTAAVVGAPDGSSRAAGDFGGEASGRQAVTLKATGDAVAWTVPAAQAGANALVLRYSIPDAPGGGGLNSSMELLVTDAGGKTRWQKSLTLTSRYAWLYGGGLDATALYNVPATALVSSVEKKATPIHIYDEIQAMLGVTLQAGDVVKLSKTAASTAETMTVDFIELETVPAALPQPTGFLSITDARCGAVPLDVRSTGKVFDGEDDSIYGSVFNIAVGGNPNFPWGFETLEKSYYSNAAADTLQDNAPNTLAGGLSMFQLADKNYAALNTCVSIVSASNSGYIGVYIPPGRFYMRGRLQVPNNVTLYGAGMWHSKFVAVNTAPPAALTANGKTGIAGTSGNPTFAHRGVPAAGVGTGVVMANFSVFGNLTQRQTIDNTATTAFNGQFINARFDNLWAEHVFSAIIPTNDSDGVRMTYTRSRNTFSDGQSLYGNTKNSSFTNSSSRGNGDDGFALWSQGTTEATTSSGNSISNSVAELQWFGKGMTLYGGKGNSIKNSVVSDVLNYGCMMVSTQFVDAALPNTVFMTGNVSDMTLTRCGGNAYNQPWGALFIGTRDKEIKGVTIERIRIDSPTYRGIDFHPFSATGLTAVGPRVTELTLKDVLVVNAPVCAYANAYQGGAVQFNNVCSCASASSAPAACGLTNLSSTTFQVTPNTCSATACR